MGLVILIDDERDFINPPEELVIFRNGADAMLWIIRVIEDGGDLIVDELWLDHDLGPDSTIRVVIDLMESWAQDGKFLPVETIYVHTQNPVGAAWIIAALKDHYNVKRVPIDALRVTGTPPHA